MFKKIINFIKNNEKQFLLLLFLFGLILKVSLIFYWNTNQEFVTHEHGMIAENIADGNGFTMHWPYTPQSTEKIEIYQDPPKIKGAFIPPFNPWLLSLFYDVFGITNNAELLYLIIMSVLSALTPLIVYLLGKRAFNIEVGIFSSIIYFFYLPAIYSVITFSGGVLYHALALLILYILFRLNKETKLLNYFVLAILLSLQTLIRSEFLLLSLVFLFVLFFINRKRKGEFKRIVFTTFLFVLAISPWVIRNTMAFGKVVPIVSHPWHEIWRGSNEYATGGSFGKNEKPNWLSKERFPEIHADLDSLEYDEKFELKVDSVFKSYAIAFWNENPTNSVLLAFKRAIILWSYDPYTPRSKTLLFVIPTLTISLLFFSVFLFYRKEISKYKDSLIYFVTFALYYTALIFAVNFEARYMVFVQSTMIPLVGLVPYYLYKKKLANKN